MDKYYLSFSLSPIGPKGFQKLLKLFGSAENAWEKSSPDKFKEAGIGGKVYSKFELFKNEFDLKKYITKLQKVKVEFIPFGDKFYPVRLREIDSPPIGLFIRGNKSLLSENQNIGVVGTRKITSYGLQTTESLVSELSSSGFIVVSGMAMGVDACAHQTAIGSKGATIAVLGCGVDCPFPRENEKLYFDILDNKGLIISEYPLGMQPNRGTFPARNRIIAGISSSILITEAAEDSGSLITADYALKQNKKVFAVPGPITSQMSRGSLKLLKEGAVLVSCAEDILVNLNLKDQAPNSKQISNIKFKKLKKDEKKIVKCLESERMTIDEIAKKTKIPVSRLSIILSEMELYGIIKNSGGKMYLV